MTTQPTFNRRPVLAAAASINLLITAFGVFQVWHAQHHVTVMLTILVLFGIVWGWLAFLYMPFGAIRTANPAWIQIIVLLVWALISTAFFGYGVHHQFLFTLL